MPVNDVSLVCSSATGGAYTRTVSIAVKYVHTRPSTYLVCIYVLYTPLALGTIKTWNIYRGVYHFANLFYFIKKEKSFLHNGVISFKKFYLSTIKSSAGACLD